MTRTFPDGTASFSVPLRHERWRVALAAVSLFAPAVALALRSEWRTLGVAALVAAYVPVLLFTAAHYLAKMHATMFEARARHDNEKVDAGAHVSSLIRVGFQGFWALLAMWAVPKFAAADPASLVPAVVLAAVLALQPMLWTDAISWGDVHCIARFVILAQVAVCAALVLIERPLILYLFIFSSLLLLPVFVVSAKMQARAALRKRPFG